MCTNEYPTTDNHDHTTTAAIEKYAALTSIITSSISYHASDRHPASTIYEELNVIKDNDRYYYYYYFFYY
jgi:hypothetical protein